MALPLIQIDSFTDEPFAGNPAAVVVLDAPRPDGWLTAVAAEMNLSETAFIQAQGDRWSLRWFTPTTEVDLCGHATLAAAHALWTEGLDHREQLDFETRSGTLSATRIDGGWIELDFPAIPIDEGECPAGLLDALGIDEAEATAERGTWALVQLGDESAVRSVDPDFEALTGVDVHECIVTARGAHAGTDFVSRLFAPAIGIPEDPVTGAAHCVLGPWWAPRLNKTSFNAEQVSARGGRLRVTVEGSTDRVRLAGRAVTVFRAELDA